MADAGPRHELLPHTREDVMRFGGFKFGCIQPDGVTCEYDMVIDRGSSRKRKKKPSKPFRSSYGVGRQGSRFLLDHRRGSG